MNPTYINKKGKTVSLTITNHCRSRFVERYNKISEEKISYDVDIDAMICKLFEHAKITTQNTKHLKERKQKHGADTLYFDNKAFRFIVQNGFVVTVELNGKKIKELNGKNTKKINTNIKNVCDVRFRIRKNEQDENYKIVNVGGFPKPDVFYKDYFDNDMKDFILTHIKHRKKEFPDEIFEAAIFQYQDIYVIVDKSKIFERFLLQT